MKRKDEKFLALIQVPQILIRVLMGQINLSDCLCDSQKSRKYNRLQLRQKLFQIDHQWANAYNLYTNSTKYYQEKDFVI